MVPGTDCLSQCILLQCPAPIRREVDSAGMDKGCTKSSRFNPWHNLWQTNDYGSNAESDCQKEMTRSSRRPKLPGSFLRMHPSNIAAASSQNIKMGTPLQTKLNTFARMGKFRLQSHECEIKQPDWILALDRLEIVFVLLDRWNEFLLF